MRIQHNIMAMNSYRNFSNNTSKLSKNLEKLSSGYRINRAGDDAAGLAISEKMRAQISGLEQAQSNAKSGVNLVQTAEGALTEVHDMLNRMVTLSEQSANGTYDDDVDRANLQKEFNQLRSEIDRIAESSNFNGINLLDGTQASKEVDYDTALGELLDKINGTTATAATNATGTITLGDALNTVTTPDGMFAGGNKPTAGQNAEVSFTMGASGNTIGGFQGANAITSGTSNANAIKGYQFTATGGTLEKDFTLFVNDVETAWSNTTTFNEGDTIKLVANKPGAMASNTFDSLTANGSGTIDRTYVGKDEGKADTTNSVGTKYELSFDISKLAAGQKFSIGDKTFELTLDASATDGPNNHFIKIGALDPADDVAGGGQENIAAAIRAKLEAVFGGGGDFKVSDAPTAANGGLVSGQFTITMTAQDGKGLATNLGQVRVNESTLREGAISGTYSAYAPAGTSVDEGTFATAEYSGIDLTSLQVGSTITVGDATLEVVADNAASVESNQIKLGDVTDNTNGFEKLVKALEGAGYTGGQIAVAGTAGDATITITDTEVGRTADELKGAAFVGVSLDTKAKTVATFADTDLDITFGETKVEDLLKAQIGIGNIELGSVFNVTVKDKNGNALAAGDTIGAGATIELEAKTAGKQADDILNALASTSANATAKVTNGRDVGEADNSGKATYELNFDLTKLAGGQKVTIGGKELSFTNKASTATNEISLQGKDLNNAADQQAVADAIVAALNDTTTGLGGSGDGTFTAAGGAVSADGKFSVNLTANNTGVASNLGAVEITAGEAGAITAAYNPTDGVTTPQTATEAKVEYAFDVSKNRKGDEITIGSTTVKVVADDDANVGTAGFISETDAKDAAKLIDAFTTAGYNEGTLSIADGKLTITGTTLGEAAEDFAAAGGKVTVTNPLDDPDAMTGGLTLQIGDTSDDFNQLTVSIDAMDSESLKIHEIDISNQKGAQDAVAVIKAAINKVSNTRGDLGATQNRLDHTLNNLSVMQENIQDAESTIRDVDVAKEMMDYTKNNILIQSAQAMLAQANQVPQGVLQLLQ